MSGLAEGATYRWIVLVSDCLADTWSPVWEFTTAGIGNQAPGQPSSPSPANGATDVETDPTLSAFVSDPDGDALTVEFGDLSGPDLVIEGEAGWQSGTFSQTATDGAGHLVLASDDAFFGAATQDLNIPASTEYLMVSDEDWHDVTVGSGAILNTQGNLLRVSGTLLNQGTITDSSSGGSVATVVGPASGQIPCSPAIRPAARSPATSALRGHQANRASRLLCPVPAVVATAAAAAVPTAEPRLIPMQTAATAVKVVVAAAAGAT